MKITVFFTENGVPKEGLTPKINIWDTEATHVADEQDMTEIAGGFYFYDFSNYDDSKDYVYRADGGESQPLGERYAVGSNAGDISGVKKALLNKMQIVNNQMILYEDDGETVYKTFNLYDQNGEPSSASVFKREEE